MSGATAIQTAAAPRYVIELVRVSTAEQETGRQYDINRDTVRRNGLTVLYTIEARDVSGRHVQYDERFQKMFRDLRERRDVIGIVVAEQSRLFRPDGFDDYGILAYFQKSRKLIYTPGDVIDPNTPGGRATLVMNGLMSGEELHRMKDRFASGKTRRRLEGAFPAGNQCLPRGVRFVRERNEIGKVVREYWQHTEDAALVRLAYERLFAGDSFRDIAAATGGKWSSFGIRRTLANPIWKGVVRYAYEAGEEEYLPKATEKNPAPKIHRKSVLKEEPVFIPLDGKDGRPYLAPLVTEDQWERAQELLAARHGRWKKSKLKNIDHPRHLATGVARCSCGQPMYGKFGGRGAHLDVYRCATLERKGLTPCGAKAARRECVDAVLEEIVAERLTDKAFLLKILSAVRETRKAEPAKAKRADAAKATFERKRKKALDLHFDGDITKKELKERVAAFERERDAVLATLPGVGEAKSGDERAVVTAIVEYFAAFATADAKEKRALFQRAVREVVISMDGIPSITINGGMIGGVNSAQRITTPLRIDSAADVLIRFPKPIDIAAAYVSRIGTSPGSVAARFRPAGRRKAA